MTIRHVVSWKLAATDFDDLDAVTRYQVHPEHKKVANFIRSVVSQRMAVDIKV